MCKFYGEEDTISFRDRFEALIVNSVTDLGQDMAVAIGNSFEIPQLDDESLREQTYPKNIEGSGMDKR